MKIRWIAIACVTALVSAYSWNARAFECPEHFAAAQATIDTAIKNIKSMENKMSQDEIAMIEAHIRQAKMSLVEAKYHHSQESGAYHHSRAIVRANEARGHAAAADALHRTMMKQ